MGFKKISIEEYVKNKVKSKNVDNLIKKMEQEPTKTIIDNFYKKLLKTTRNVILNELAEVNGLKPADVIAITLCVANKYHNDLENILTTSLEESQKISEEDEEERGKYVS